MPVPRRLNSGARLNLFNRVNLDPRSVAASLTDGNFSKATGVFYPRTVQLGARIEF
ncbi:MAG: hypothetical protein J2P52_01950 [Blastocatellia bacterium]|nr:hypothetical protein [Blastocatellia bacterium]